MVTIEVLDMFNQEKKLKNFDGFIVHQEKDLYHINGMKIIKTRRWLSCRNPNSTLYEVKLENGRLYQLYEHEMTKEGIKL